MKLNSILLLTALLPVRSSFAFANTSDWNCEGIKKTTIQNEIKRQIVIDHNSRDYGSGYVSIFKPVPSESE